MKLDSLLQTDFLLLESALTLAVAQQRCEESSLPYSHIIIKRPEGEGSYYYLYPKHRLQEVFVTYPPGTTLKDALNLHEYAATRTVHAGNFAKVADEEEQLVVLSHGKPAGYIVYIQVVNLAMGEDKPALPAAESAGSRDELESFPAMEKGDLESFPSRGIDGGNEGLESFPATESPAPVDKANFQAFPFISDPGDVAPGAKFSVDVGFSQELDKALRNVRGISIARPDPDDFLEVALMPIGADVANNTLKKLPLDVDAKITFHCVAHPEAETISLVATYFYKRQPVGTATRMINETVETEGFHFALPQTDDPDGTVDLTAIICWDNPAQQLRWRLIAADPALDVNAEVKVADTREFAANLSAQLDPNVNQGQAAFNTLATLGQNIAALIPPAFFTVLRQIRQRSNRPPRLLLLTDEPYIPWELAYHRDLRLDPATQPFLHMQTCMGRWWVSDQVVMPPPTALPVRRLSVVATDYHSNPGLAELVEAENEKKFLVDQFQAAAVKAELDSLLAVTGEIPAFAGHLLHLALHGISKPDLNEQEILLEDGKPLSANALIGPYFQGDTPAISFMFLNACQVGTAGKTLGQASGFPGILLKKGMLGFIAPLWSVDDVPARSFSEHFYHQTLEAGRPIGEVLLELRRGVDYKNSLTELAYIYYGHPALKLVKSFEHGK